MQGNATEIDERNLLQLDALLSHGYGLSPQLVMRSKGLSIEAKALYGYLSSFAGAGDTAFPSTSRILEELDISKKSSSTLKRKPKTSSIIFRIKINVFMFSRGFSIHTPRLRSNWITRCFPSSPPLAKTLSRSAPMNTGSVKVSTLSCR